MTFRRAAFLFVVLVFAASSIAFAQSSAPTYRWTVVQKADTKEPLTTKISYAPASITTTGGSVSVWIVTEHYRASDNYRDKYYGQFSIDCRSGYARETASVFDRFGRGKSPRYGRKKPGFNDYSNVLDPNKIGESAVLRMVARKTCPK
jgi:hypothetical protein